MEDKMINKLKEILKDNELTLQEIYDELPEVKQSSIRATLNTDVKKGINFIRVSRAKYKLKQ